MDLDRLRNDLWKYSGGQWTWVAGSNLIRQQGSYNRRISLIVQYLPKELGEGGEKSEEKGGERPAEQAAEGKSIEPAKADEKK